MYYWQIASTAGQARPSRHAVIAPNGTRTWRQLNDNVDHVAGLLTLERGLRPGTRVGVLLHNGAWQPELYYGISKAACVVVPLNWRLTTHELAGVIADAGVELVFVDRELVERIGSAVAETIVVDRFDPEAYEAMLAAAPAADMPRRGSRDDDLAMIAYTSGTTGHPKGVMHTHRSLTESALRLAAEMRVRPGEVFCTCLPMFFAGANSAMSAPLLRGCTIVSDDFSPARFVEAVERHGVSATIMVPTMISQVLRHVGEDGAALDAVKNWCYAGDAMPGAELRRAMARYGPVFSGYYGQLESGLVGTSFLSEDHVVGAGEERRLRSAGRPTIAASLRVVDLETGRDVPHDGESRGEIWIQAPSVMKGYWNRPELTSERISADGWLRTTDIGVRDEDGFLYIVDRATDMIITGGINVFPREIENVISSHPDVHAVAVVGMPSDEWGEEVTACIVPNAERDPAALEREIVEQCREQLSGYKKPRRVVLRNDLPMTGSGKVMKGRLRELLLAEQQDDVRLPAG